jgi:signal transduction histidine kinase/ActR/RegA family two-component response regulator
MISAWFRRLAVHRKLMTMLMVTSGGAILLAGAGMMGYHYLQFRQTAVADLSTTATLTLVNTRPALSFEDESDAQLSMAPLTTRPGLIVACLYNTEGRLFTHVRGPARPMDCPSSPPPEGYRFASYGLELVKRDAPGDKPAQWLVLRSDLGLLRRQLGNQALITLLVLAGALLPALLVSAALQRVVSQPVIELARVATDVSRTGDYSRRAIKRTDDELGILADAFNTMLERITDAEAARETALAREREANRTKDEFLATLSHELRTPLSAILGWTQLMRRQAVPPAEQARALERIELNAQTQNRLISDLLDLSRILSGKLSLQRDAVDLVAIAQSVLDSHAPLAQTRGVRLTLDAQAGPLHADVDADRVAQIVSNLISNALKFTAAGGAVTLSMRRTGEMVELVVADTGEGIAPDFLPRIFEPFRQADASHSRTHGGLGLGLAIVKRIAEMHGGDVMASSEGLGRGAAFTVRLPAATTTTSDNAPDANRLPTKAPNLAGLSVLIVDDDGDARELVNAALSAAGARSIAAASAADAITVAVQSPPDVLITDLGMPGMGGYAMVETMRARLGATMPPVVIALSAFASQRDVDESLARGFAAHITKPFDSALLVETVEQLSHGVRLHRP